MRQVGDIAIVVLSTIFTLSYAVRVKQKRSSSNTLVDPDPAIPDYEVGTFEWSKCSAKPVLCGQDYFREVYEQFRLAQREVIIMGWRYEIDQALFAEPDSKIPTKSLKEIIHDAVNDVNRPDLHVYILFWKTTLSEESFSIGLPVTDMVNSLRTMGGKVHVLLDNGRHFSPTLLWSAHIKVTIFDRKVGYCGGIDFADTRLDSPEHILPNPERYPVPDSPHGSGKPWQDVMVKVEGRAANDLATIAAERWLTWCDAGSTKSDKIASWKYIKSAFVKWSGDSERRSACSEAHLLKPEPVGKLIAKFHDHATAKKVELKVDYGYETKTRKIKTKGDVVAFDLYRHDLGKRAMVSIESGKEKAVYPIEYVNSDTHSLVNLEWQPFQPSDPTDFDNLCRVILSGDDLWLGHSQPNGLLDILGEHTRMIQEAKKSIYIENQYLSTDVGSLAGPLCQSLDTGVVNDLGVMLYKKITENALEGNEFSVVIVIPLATEESETHYPNLRSAECLYEALTAFWLEKQLERPLHDYFGIYHLANVVLHQRNPAFYGIFVHSKLIVTDYDSPDGAAIVGSANLNDRSLRGHRDAEVSVAVKGEFKFALMQDLMKYHANLGELPDSKLLAAKIHEVASSNMDILMPLGIDWRHGYIKDDGNWKYMFNQNMDPKNEMPDVLKFSLDESFKVGSGVHWTKLQEQFHKIPSMVGHVLPYIREVWGSPSAYWSIKHNHPQGTWLQLNQSIHETEASSADSAIA